MTTINDVPSHVLFTHVFPRLPTVDLLNLPSVNRKMLNMSSEIEQMVVKSVKSRLTDLSPNSKLIDFLQKEAVIAGGSIVYALNDFVPKSSVGNINVFINDKDKFCKIMSFIKDNYPVCEIEVVNANNYSGMSSDEAHKFDVSIVTIRFTKENHGNGFLIVLENVSIQLILQDYSDPNDLIKSFDLDYVQCAIHRDKIFRSNICAESHSQRRIIRSTEFPVSLRHLRKAVWKGFPTCMFGPSCERSVETWCRSIIRNIDTKSLRSIQKRDKVNDIYYHNNVVAKKLVCTEKKSWHGKTIFSGRIKLAMATGSFELDVISVKLTVNDLGYDMLNIKPVHFGKYRTSEYCENSTTRKKVNPGKYVANIELYVVEDKLKMKVHEIFPRNHVLPVGIDEEFEIGFPDEPMKRIPTTAKWFGSMIE